MKQWMLLSATLLLILSSFAQQEIGNIEGVVVDDSSSEPISFANVLLYQNGVFMAGVSADFDGKYVFNQIDSGKYTLQVSFVGYEPVKKVELLVVPNQKVYLEVVMKQKSSFTCCCFVPLSYQKPLLEIDNTTIETTFTRGEILRSPY